MAAQVRDVRASYKTLRGEGDGLYEEKKSRFFGAAGPAATEGDALAFINAVRQRRKDASHHVFAYVCGEGSLTKRYSDDGEPQGTAGVPVLDVMEKGGLSDSVIVVTRYFGGTLLGAAGLIRSYGKAASLAVASAGPVIKSLASEMIFLVGYELYDSLRNMIDKGGYAVSNVVYGVDVELSVVVPFAEAGALRARVDELTAGAAVIEQGRELYIDEIITTP